MVAEIVDVLVDQLDVGAGVDAAGGRLQPRVLDLGGLMVGIQYVSEIMSLYYIILAGAVRKRVPLLPICTALVGRVSAAAADPHCIF